MQVSPTKSDLSHTTTPPPGRRTGHTNTEEDSSIHTYRRDKQTHRGRERDDSMEIREERLNLLGDCSEAQHSLAASRKQKQEQQSVREMQRLSNSLQFVS